MSKVLLIKSGNLATRAKGMTPPLGLMYISSYLKKYRNVEIMIFDTRLYQEPLRKIYNLIMDFDPDLVGISSITLESPLLHQIAHLVKKVSDIPVIIGGPYATSVPYEAMKNINIDITVIGEGEVTFKEIMDALFDGKKLNEINGIIYREQGGIITTPPRDYVKNLDEIPFPDWELIELKKYAKYPSMSTVGFRPYMVLLTSRGCPFHCTYCHNIFGKMFRARSVENVLNEMRILIEKYNINDFEIIDDIVNFNRERFKSILTGIINNGWEVNLSFPNGVRADMLDEEIIYLMKRAGTLELSIAVETTSKRLQKMIRKNLNLEKVQRMMEVAVKSGMFVRGFFMLGFPTETEEEIKDTIKFACKSNIHEALFLLVNPFGGTELSRQIEEQIRIPLNVKVEDFDYYAMPFNASNVPDKRLHRLYTMAYLRFYANPVRIFRILWRKKYWGDLLYYLKRLIIDLLPPKGNKKQMFEPIDIIIKKDRKPSFFTYQLKKNLPDNVINIRSLMKKFSR